jgi:transposase InsO family protein
MTEAFPWDTAPRYLLRDRDKSYGSTFRHRVRAMGITEIITASRSPWQNPYAERLIGSTGSGRSQWIGRSAMHLHRPQNAERGRQDGLRRELPAQPGTGVPEVEGDGE